MLWLFNQNVINSVLNHIEWKVLTSLRMNFKEIFTCALNLHRTWILSESIICISIDWFAISVICVFHIMATLHKGENMLISCDSFNITQKLNLQSELPEYWISAWLHYSIWIIPLHIFVILTTAWNIKINNHNLCISTELSPCKENTRGCLYLVFP